MTHVTYKIVEHDGGWAYTVNGVFSEPFPNRAAALAAARRVAAEQRVPGRTEAIEYETADGRWHSETAAGNDRPETEVRGIGGTQCRRSGDGETAGVIRLPASGAQDRRSPGETIMNFSYAALSAAALP